MCLNAKKKSLFSILHSTVHNENSRWTNHGSGLSNAYYENLADFQSGWRQRRTRNGEKWQWTNDFRDFALNSDMSMWINTEVGEL